MTMVAHLDHPQNHCEFGEHGWQNEDVNILTAVANYTRAVMDGGGFVMNSDHGQNR